MSSSERVRNIKHAQRESFLLREISSFFLQIAQDNPELQSLYIHHVVLAPEGSTCSVFFYTNEGKAAFDNLIDTLILYKPSMRASLAKISSGRYVPQLIFRYAEQVEKQNKVNDLIETLKKEGRL